MWNHAVSHTAWTAIWVSHMLGQPLPVWSHAFSITGLISVSQQISNGTTWTFIVKQGRQVSEAGQCGDTGGIRGARGECISLGKTHRIHFPSAE